jgi:hypothetical protein
MGFCRTPCWKNEMPDASAYVKVKEWRIVRLEEDGPHWPFLDMDVGEAFIEGDVSKWGSLRTRASSLRRKFGDRDMDRSWSVKKEAHDGVDVIVVRRTA